MLITNLQLVQCGVGDNDDDNISNDDDQGTLFKREQKSICAKVKFM